MANATPKGLALAGSILATVVGSLLVIGSILLIGLAQSYSSADYFSTLGIVLVLLAIPGVVLGCIGCRIEPRAILANAIVHSVLTLAAFLFVAMTRVNPVQVIVLLSYLITTILLYLGVPQARRYRAAQRDQDE